MLDPSPVTSAEHKQDGLRVADHVRYQSQDHGGVVILDTVGGEWLALNATAGDFWRAWSAGNGLAESLRIIAARHPHVPLEVLHADADRLVSELRAHGLLASAAAGPPCSEVVLAAGSTVTRSTTANLTAGGAVMAEAGVPAGLPRPRWPRGGLALCALIAACLIVRCSSFRIQLALVRATRRWRRLRSAASVEAASTVAAIDWAVRRYPWRAACLEQSLAAVLLAAAAGRRLDWCLGAASDPYRFHAWVEAGGRPVPASDAPASPLGFVRLLSA